ncbi:hypothetical protein HMPREF9446_02594 [Bacteroides fluxus YIT 12057]|uniref:Uncharacterized protein n=1 Tax=Bacteroides fluxus YIT 12057 TaxID=763034 RepID=F3PV20_9BACE|nr:hypothetical protein HMPREF9446_02594 [Bacteroides fluxus YIT 12057]
MSQAYNPNRSNAKCSIVLVDFMKCGLFDTAKVIFLDLRATP